MDYTRFEVETLPEARIGPDDWVTLMTIIARVAEVVEEAYWAKAIRDGNVIAWKDADAFTIQWRCRYQREHFQRGPVGSLKSLSQPLGGSSASLAVDVAVVLNTNGSEFARLPGQLFLSLGIDEKWMHDEGMEITEGKTLDPPDYASATIFRLNRRLYFEECPDWREMNFVKLGNRIARPLLEQLDRCVSDFHDDKD